MKRGKPKWDVNDGGSDLNERKKERKARMLAGKLL